MILLAACVSYYLLLLCLSAFFASPDELLWTVTHAVVRANSLKRIDVQLSEMHAIET